MHTVKVVEPGRSVTFTSDLAATAVFMAREWVTKPVLQGGTPKPPTQIAQPQGFEAFGPMGERQ